MASSTSTTDTGINQAYIDKLQEDSSTKIDGVIGDAYQKLVDTGLPQQQVAALSASQLKALEGLEGNALTQAFQQQLGQTTTTSLDTGAGVLNNIATGQQSPTEASLVAGANTIAESAPIQAQLDAMNAVATTDKQNLTDAVNRQLNEESLPSIYRDSQTTGGTGSSRSAIAEGIARRSATEATALGTLTVDQNNAAAQAELRGNAFNTGLAAASETQQAALASQQAAAGSLAGLGLQAGTTQASLDQQAIGNLIEGGAIEQSQLQNQYNVDYVNESADRLKDTQDVTALQGMLGSLRGTVDTNTVQSEGSLTSSDYAQILIPGALGLYGEAVYG